MDPAMKNLQQRLDKLEMQKDAAYRERNKLVSLAARMAIALGHSAGLAMHDPTDAQWDPKWRTIVVIDLPTGQVTWHIHDDEVGLFLFLPLYDKWKWDGHDTDEKYRRVQSAFPIDPATGRPK